MTLNAVIAFIMRFFTKFDSFSGRLYDSGWRSTYNVRKILSPSSSVLLLAKTITHPAARSLCDSWASCYMFLFFYFILFVSHINSRIKLTKLSTDKALFICWQICYAVLLMHSLRLSVCPDGANNGALIAVKFKLHNRFTLPSDWRHHIKSRAERSVLSIMKQT